MLGPWRVRTSSGVRRRGLCAGCGVAGLQRRGEIQIWGGARADLCFSLSDESRAFRTIVVFGLPSIKRGVRATIYQTI